MTARLARRGGDNNPINSTTRDELSEGVLEKINDFNVASDSPHLAAPRMPGPPPCPASVGNGRRNTSMDQTQQPSPAAKPVWPGSPKGFMRPDPEVMFAVTEIDFTGWAIMLMLGGTCHLPFMICRQL
jgi:hypothetical protein